MLLALANLLHHKVRSLLSALAVGIGVAMLVTLLGLTHGSLDEITTRGRAIRADLLIAPRDASSVVAGRPFAEGHVRIARAVAMPSSQPVAERVAPVLRMMAPINRVDAAVKAKDLQTVFGIRPEDWAFFCDQPMIEGQLFDQPADQERKLFDLLRRGVDGRTSAASQPDEADRRLLDAALQLVIDQRLAKFAKIHAGDYVEAWGRRFRVAAIAPTGVTVRVFAPLATLRYINESPGEATFLLIDLSPGVDPKQAREVLAEKVGGNVMTIAEYSAMLTELWAIIPQYTQITSIVVLVVAFLFVLVIMYTVVIQRTREIGILKSLGASGAYIVLIVLAESMMLSLAGTAIGLGLSFAAGAAILHFKPLLTVDLSGLYLFAGVATGLIGGLLSGLYPALVAVRQDPVTALSYE